VIWSKTYFWGIVILGDSPVEKTVEYTPYVDVLPFYVSPFYFYLMLSLTSSLIHSLIFEICFSLSPFYFIAIPSIFIRHREILVTAPPVWEYLVAICHPVRNSGCSRPPKVPSAQWWAHICSLFQKLPIQFFIISSFSSS